MHAYYFLYQIIAICFISEKMDAFKNMRMLCIRHYVLGIGYVLVAIMVVINICNIYTYRKRNRERKDTMQPLN